MYVFYLFNFNTPISTFLVCLYLHQYILFYNFCLTFFIIIFLFVVVLIKQAKQLKDYENAVIAKRLEELDDDEVQALVEDIERDDF